MRTTCTSAVLVMLLAAAPLAAQEFHPPPVRRTGEGTRLGLLGFGVRGGIDVSGQSQLVLGVTLDAGNLVSGRFRLRPSGEIGVFNGDNTYVGSFEGVYRFTFNWLLEYHAMDAFHHNRLYAGLTTRRGN